jgi:hypothetical protein
VLVYPLIMSTSRQIHLAFFQSMTVAELPLPAAFTFQGLWCLADDTGTLPDDPQRVKDEIWLLRNDVGIDDIKTHLDTLTAGGFIERIKVGSFPFLRINNWNKYQRPKGRPKGAKIEYTPEFEALWSLYPRKAPKSLAYEAYQARLRQGYTHEEMLRGVKGYLADLKKRGTDEKYFMLGATFFGPHLRWQDYLSSTPSAPAFDPTEAWVTACTKGWWRMEDGTICESSPADFDIPAPPDLVKLVEDRKRQMMPR